MVITFTEGKLVESYRGIDSKELLQLLRCEWDYFLNEEGNDRFDWQIESGEALRKLEVPGVEQSVLDWLRQQENQLRAVDIVSCLLMGYLREHEFLNLELLEHLVGQLEKGATQPDELAIGSYDTLIVVLSWQAGIDSRSEPATRIANAFGKMRTNFTDNYFNPVVPQSIDHVISLHT